LSRRAARPRYGGWPPAAVDVVERACARHGGWTRFESIEEISARVVFIGGPLPVVKGVGRSYTNPSAVRVEPHSQTTTWVDSPAAGNTGRYERGDVSIIRAHELIRMSSAHRARMPLLRWTPLDALYFFGYALANYWALPFLLASTRFVRASERTVTVDFPDGFDTHSTRQRFHFDETGLLVRCVADGGRRRLCIRPRRSIGERPGQLRVPDGVTAESDGSRGGTRRCHDRYGFCATITTRGEVAPKKTPGYAGWPLASVTRKPIPCRSFPSSCSE
jgi:hypothetical protein